MQPSVECPPSVPEALGSISRTKVNKYTDVCTESNKTLSKMLLLKKTIIFLDKGNAI